MCMLFAAFVSLNPAVIDAVGLDKTIAPVYAKTTTVEDMIWGLDGRRFEQMVKKLGVALKAERLIDRKREICASPKCQAVLASVQVNWPDEYWKEFAKLNYGQHTLWIMPGTYRNDDDDDDDDEDYENEDDRSFGCFSNLRRQ